MPQFFENKHVRALRVVTEAATFEGLLTLTLHGRTLDELNATSRVFLPLDSPSVLSGDFDLVPAQLAINKSSILFAFELDVAAAAQEQRPAHPGRAKLARSVLSLCLRNYQVEGHVHFLESGGALGRLYLAGHPFIALTSASIVGPGMEVATPFLAVNREHVLFGQEAFRVQAVMESAGTPVASPAAD